MAIAHKVNTPRTSTRPRHTADNDPLFGIQQTTDSPVEAARAPEHEVILKPLGSGEPRKSRFVAGLLGLLLGGLGIHRFYLGYPRIGAAQACFFVLLISVGVIAGYALELTPSGVWMTALGCAVIVPLWGAIEGVMILAGMMRLDGAGRPMKPMSGEA